jgi:hypothetical protein
MQVGLVIVDNAALYQDSIELGEITIEEFLKSISKQWKREVVSAFLVNDGNAVLDLTNEQDILITDIYNKYEFELGYSELWIEIGLGKDTRKTLDKTIAEFR